jgi:hypothetical protein
MLMRSRPELELFLHFMLRSFELHPGLCPRQGTFQSSLHSLHPLCIHLKVRETDRERESKINRARKRQKERERE